MRVHTHTHTHAHTLPLSDLPAATEYIPGPSPTISGLKAKGEVAEQGRI